MRLKTIELSGFKSFAKKTTLHFDSSITAIVGPNGSGKSNVAEAFRFVLGEQSMKSMRGRRGEDLIWNGSQATPRAGRASAKLLFDNHDRLLNIDFDEVSIERVVHRDGVNDYSLNGSTVRLRDVAELLAQANIGASGHHIISQGEADRVLSASSRERREMLEDALGLTAYLYKKIEAERKLEKTGENVREVEGLRRELAPHLRFLQSQVKKIEESQKLRATLAEKYLEYLKHESVYLRVSEALVKEEKGAPKQEHSALDQKIVHLRAELSKKHDDAGATELIRLEEEGRKNNHRRDSLARELGRLEGEIAAHERLGKPQEGTMSLHEARNFAQRIEHELEALQKEPSDIKGRLATLLHAVKNFLQNLTTNPQASKASSNEALREKRTALEGDLAALQGDDARIGKETAALRRKIESSKDASREAERELFAAMTRRSELEVALARLRAREEVLERERAQYKSELGEAAALVGRAVVEHEAHQLRDGDGRVVSDAEIAQEPRDAQDERRKKLERMKIRLEESGLGNAQEVLKEHQETSERDEFLARELTDLAASREALEKLILELTETLEERFTSGIDKINTEFNIFFKLMFGGGSAALSVTKEKKVRRGATSGEEGEAETDEIEEEIEEGIEIAVSLPHKRIKGLHMLSGGERALTSIALIFAMSQVNPPPFLILDETDAALDEANSRRYGDMIENLSRKSQLILITHNRETMSRAGILYGITMGSDGVSKLLSVKFEEAAAVAK